MPRLPPWVVRGLRQQSEYLPLVFKATRDVPAAINELRWLTEHVHKQVPPENPKGRKLALHKLCRRRERHEPLQYILGSQPFGELEIKCEKGVLIPRQDTEAYTVHVAKLLNSDRLSRLIAKDFVPRPRRYKNGRLIVDPEPRLNILDICSGSGCISLLLHARLCEKFHNLSIRGWDISELAVKLAQENLELNIKTGVLSPLAKTQVQFQKADVFEPSEEIFQQLENVDIIISNPPYISSEKLLTEATRSVREWEPTLALVPKQQQTLYRNHNRDRRAPHDRPEDVFYSQLLYYHARRKNCRVLIMEVGDDEQALRVVAMALKRTQITANNSIEIWRDAPDQAPQVGERIEVSLDKTTIPIRGSGNMRTVVLILELAGRFPSKRPDDFAPPPKKKAANSDPDDEIPGFIKRELESARSRP